VNDDGAGRAAASLQVCWRWRVAARVVPQFLRGEGGIHCQQRSCKWRHLKFATTPILEVVDLLHDEVLRDCVRQCKHAHPDFGVDALDEGDPVLYFFELLADPRDCGEPWAPFTSSNVADVVESLSQRLLSSIVNSNTMLVPAAT
jgi:hypothetical protein